MKICCLSDLHGYLPNVPECDLLILAGDYCPSSKITKQFFWLKTEFADWLNKIPESTQVIGVAGNHDWIFERNPDLVPKMNWTYLQDNGTEWSGLKIWGSPWQPRFWDWAFNADEDFMEKKWEMIPNDIDILILHGPPQGYGDLTIHGEHTGSPSLTKKIEEIKPKLVVAGHIHHSYGQYHIGETICVNASYVDESYIPKNKPIIIEL